MTNEEEILDIKRENYKLRKENFELIQDNVYFQEEISKLRKKLQEKICMESSSQFKDLRKELEIHKKINDLMANEIYRLFYIVSQNVGYYQAEDYSDGEDTTIEEIKEYFRKKVENERNKV